MLLRDEPNCFKRLVTYFHKSEQIVCVSYVADRYLLFHRDEKDVLCFSAYVVDTHNNTAYIEMFYKFDEDINKLSPESIFDIKYCVNIGRRNWFGLFPSELIQFIDKQ